MIDFKQLLGLRNSKAVSNFLVGKYDNDIASFLTDLDFSLNWLLKTDIKKAGSYIGGIQQLFGYLPDKYEPRILAIRGRYYHFSGNYRLALKYYLKALRLHRAAANKEGVARLAKGLIDVYKYLGKYDEALKIGKESLYYFRKKKLHIDVAQVLNNIGNLYHRMDNNRIALSYYNKARAIFVQKGGFQLAMAELNLANVHANMNQLKKAEDLYREAADLYHEAGMDISETRARCSLAYLLSLGDQYTEAIKIYEQVYCTFIKLGDPKAAAISQLDLIEINIHLNQYGTAIMVADQNIREFRRLGMRYEEAKTYYFAASAHIKLGDYRRALTPLKNAEIIFKREKNNLWLGMICAARSILFIAKRQYEKAIKSSTEARILFKKSGGERHMIDAEITLIEAVFKSGDVRRGLTLSGQLFKKKLVSSQSYRLNYLIGESYYRSGDFITALRYYKKSVNIIEKILTGLYPDQIRFFFVIDKYDSYRKVVDCLLRLGRVEDSFISNLAALKIINGKSGIEAKLRKEVSPELIEKRNELRAALRKLNQSPRNDQREAAGAVSYHSIEQKLWWNERKIRAMLYPEKVFREDKSRGEYDFRKYLKNGETVISFFSSDSMTGAFCAGISGVEFVKFDIASNELNVVLRKLHFIFEKAVFGLRDVDRTRQISDYYLAFISQKVFEPLISHIAGGSVIIIADSHFGQIPFMALKNSTGEYYKEKFALKIIVNPEDLKLREASSFDFSEARNAVFAVSSDILPSIDIEAGQIKKTFRKAALFINETANCQNLIKELKEADGFVHIAAHASRSSENPLFSRILMSDGPFFPFDLFGFGIKAKLIALSGCQTAAPGLYYGNSFSLAKAFYQAGSQHVLATLWPVSDKLSMLFMIEFYQALADVGDICKAYQKAVNRIAGITDNPAFWSSFVLLGI